MTNWSQSDVSKHMKVYSQDGEHVGHIADLYEDSFLLREGILPTRRYIPYSGIAAVKENRVELTLSSDEVKDRQWEKRPDYENHPGDPTQIFYDEGHGVANPFTDKSTD